jgi:hypothetical protein
MAPRSQKADQRKIAFRLEDGEGSDTTLGLVIRPEDLSYNDVALQAVVQTFGGAFLDDFGVGVSAISMSGHTGWGAGSRVDGFEAFQDLYETTWLGWQAARKRSVEAARDPRKVKLTLIDDLDERVCVVAPGAFSLKRSRSRPLLHLFAINLIVLGDDVSPQGADALDLSSQPSLDTVTKGLASLQSSADTLTGKAASLRQFIDSSLAAPLHSVVSTATAAMQKVVDVVGAAHGVVTAETAPFVGIAQDLSLLGRNTFNTYNAIVTMPDFLRHEVSTVAAAFNNAYCVLGNAFRKASTYPDYDPLYGSSNCSSTIGGSPISPLLGRNPWEVILPTSADVAAVTPDARANVVALLNTDPVLAPMGASELAARASAAINGITLAWL